MTDHDDDMTMLADLRAIVEDEAPDAMATDEIAGDRIRVFGGSTADINELIERIVDRFEDGACHDKASIRDVLTEVFFDDGDA